MLTALVEADWLSAVVAFGGAAIAGALNPDEPVRSGLFTVALPILGGVVRTLVDSPALIGVVLVSGALAAVFALIASHVGAGLQRRRLVTRSR